MTSAKAQHAVLVSPRSRNVTEARSLTSHLSSSAGLAIRMLLVALSRTSAPKYCVLLADAGKQLLKMLLMMVIRSDENEGERMSRQPCVSTRIQQVSF